MRNKLGQKITKHERSKQIMSTTPKQDNDNIMTLAEVLSYLKISRESVNKAIKNGQLRTFKIGNRYRFLRSDINQYIDNMCTPTITMEAKNETEDNRICNTTQKK